MKKLNLFLMTIAFLGMACSHHTRERTPASVETEKESTHEKFQGAFDKPY